MFSKLFRRGASRTPETPQVPEGCRIYAVGDIHGRLDLIRELHGFILKDADGADDVWRKVVIYLGDYIDRGMESREVVDFLLDEPLPGFESIYLKGNHEASLLQFLKDTGIGPGWLTYGGDTTLFSYGVNVPGPARDPQTLGVMQAYLKRNLDERHLEFYNALEYSHSEGDYFFVHAGVAPGVPLAEQNEQDLLWIRDSFLKSRVDFGKIIVHGHTIDREPVIRPNRIGIDTGAYNSGRLTCLVLQGAERSFLRT